MPVAPDLSGSALDGRYELHAVIGEGTFGRVYRGYDRRLARAVAVKLIKPWWADDPDWLSSFEREAQLLARINDPGIVQIFDVGCSADGLYYVAELVDGESLEHRLRRGALSPGEACEIAEQLCRALAQAHRKRVVHRDVKPANILISDDGRVKVGDFGVARLAESSTDGAAATIVGTPRYMAPEQARGRPTTPATDVYSVGIVLYEMLAGHPPFREKSAVELALRHLQDPPPPLPANTPRSLTAVVDRALEKQPANRYSDGAAMADALAQARAAAPDGERNGAGRVPAPGAAPSVAPATLAPATRALTAKAGDDKSTSRLPSPPQEAGATRVAAPMTPRRNVNPAARRQSRAAFALVLLILAAMAVAAFVLAAGARVRVPELRGLSRSTIASKARHLGLHATFAAQYAAAPIGIAISQSPSAGSSVDTGATVGIVLSAGPPPVSVPRLVGQAAADAQAALQRRGLRASVAQIPAPGISTGTVARQSPSAGVKLFHGATVSLSVAQPPRWWPLTTFAGDGKGQSVPFRIRGNHWRAVYSMGYQGTCTLLLICSGPSASVSNVSTGASAAQFDLGEGDHQVQTFDFGPGVYQLDVSPGSDTAHWSISVEDYY